MNDISDILFGKARKGVLSLLFSNPDQEFYGRQVIKSVGAGQGAVQRELERLSQAGILSKTRKGNAIFYQANPACSVFHELNGLMTKTTGVLQEMAAALRSLSSEIHAAFVYGQHAEGQISPGAIVEILIIGTVDPQQVDAALRSTIMRHGVTTNVTVYGVAEFRHKAAMGQQFLYTVLRGRKAFLVGDERQLAALS